MTPEQFKKLLQSQRKELKQAFARTLPVKIGVAAEQHLKTISEKADL